MASNNERFTIDVVLNDQRFQAGIRNILNGLKRTGDGSQRVERELSRMGESVNKAVTQMSRIPSASQGIELAGRRALRTGRDGARMGRSFTDAGQALRGIGSASTGLQAIQLRSNQNIQSAQHMGNAFKLVRRDIQNLGSATQGIEQLGRRALRAGQDGTQMGRAFVSTGQAIRGIGQSASGLDTIQTRSNQARQSAQNMGNAFRLTRQDIQNVGIASQGIDRAGRSSQTTGNYARQMGIAFRGTLSDIRGIGNASEGLNRISSSTQRTSNYARQMGVSFRGSLNDVRNIGSASEGIHRVSRASQDSSRYATQMGVAFRGILPSVNGVGRSSQGVASVGQAAHSSARGADALGISMMSALKVMAGIGIAQAAMEGLTASIKGAVVVGMDYTKQMSKVEAISGSSSIQMAQLGANARKLGAETKWSATNVAEAYEYMALAGWNSNQMLEASLPMLNLATTGALDLARASDIVTDTMTPFGIAASEAGRVADVFATAQATANLNVEMLGETMKYAAPIAATFGASLEDTTVIAQIFANSGIKASMAGTALRAGLSRLAQPPKPAADALDKLNVSTVKTDGSMKSLRDIIGELSPKFNKLTNQQQVAAAKAIFGEEAYAGWVMVLKQGLPEFDRLHGLLDNSSGSADRMAKIMSNNLSGAMDNAKSAAENLGLILFSKVERALTGSTNASIGFMESLSKMLDPYGKSVEAAKLMQQEEQKLAQTEALLQSQRKNGVISQKQYTMAMDDAKARFQENTSYGKNLADALKGVDMQLQSGKISQFQYNDMQNTTIKNMRGQVAATKDTYTAMNGLLKGYADGKIGAQQMAFELSNQNFWMKQNSVDGGAMQRAVEQLNQQFLGGKLTQDGYTQGLQQISQKYAEGNLAGEVFSQRMGSLDQMLANGVITQEQYNQGKRDAITTLQENGTQSGILKQMIDELDKQLANGEITQEQYNQKKKEAQIEAYNLSMAIEEEKKSQEKLNAVMEKLAPIMEELRQVAVVVWTEVTEFLKQCMTEITEFIGDDMEEVKLVWSVIWFAIKLVVSSIWEGIKLIIHGSLDLIKGIIQFFGGLFEGDFSKMWEGIKNIFWGAIQIILGVFNLTFIRGLLTGIVKFGVSFLKSSGQIFGNFAKNSGQIFVNFVENGWTWAVNFIKNFGQGLRDLPIRMAQIAVDAWHSFANINWLGLGKNIIIDIVNGIYSMSSQLFKAASWMASQLNPVNWFSGGGSGRSAADAGSGGAMLSSTGGIGGQLFSPFSQGGLALASDSVASFNQSGASDFARAMGQLQSIQVMVSQPQKTSSQAPYMTNPQNQKPLEITVEAPIYVDGRELARGTAHYNSQEISRYEDRQNRGTGGIKKW